IVVRGLAAFLRPAAALFKEGMAGATVPRRRHRARANRRSAAPESRLGRIPGTLVARETGSYSVLSMLLLPQLESSAAGARLTGDKPLRSRSPAAKKRAEPLKAPPSWFSHRDRQIATMLSACGPFWPCVTVNWTFWPSCRVLRPSPTIEL